MADLQTTGLPRVVVNLHQAKRPRRYYGHWTGSPPLRVANAGMTALAE